MEEALEELIQRIRAELKEKEKELRASLGKSIYSREQAYAGQHAEMKAQTMLAVRRIEDARMRCGKILQYAGDGVSIYDKA